MTYCQWHRLSIVVAVLGVFTVGCRAPEAWPGERQDRAALGTLSPARVCPDSGDTTDVTGARAYVGAITQPAVQLQDTIGPKGERRVGRLLVQFVIDTAGKADMRTFRALNSTNEDLVPAVREFIRASGFTPPAHLGCRVRQVVQMPFEFY